jgi:hypothetical protein
MDYAPARFHRSERKLAEAGEPFAYTAENQARFDEIVTRYPEDERKSAILYALYLVQQQQGYITGASMRFVASQIRCTAAEVEDVVSYYTMFYTKPVHERLAPEQAAAFVDDIRKRGRAAFTGCHLHVEK